MIGGRNPKKNSNRRQRKKEKKRNSGRRRKRKWLLSWRKKINHPLQSSSKGDCLHTKGVINSPWTPKNRLKKGGTKRKKRGTVANESTISVKKSSISGGKKNKSPSRGKQRKRIKISSVQEG